MVVPTLFQTKKHFSHFMLVSDVILLRNWGILSKSGKNLTKIFDPFFTTNKQIGTGLGLHVVYNLVTQKLKGTVNCESEEGKGVLVTVNVPLNVEK